MHIYGLHIYIYIYIYLYIYMYIYICMMHMLIVQLINRGLFQVSVFYFLLLSSLCSALHVTYFLVMNIFF
jgi:hypothetical protein